MNNKFLIGVAICFTSLFILEHYFYESKIMSVYTKKEIYYIDVDAYEITSEGTNIKQKFNSFAELNQQVIRITTTDNK